MADDDQGNDYYNEGNVSVICASWAPVVGFMGCAAAVILSSEFRSSSTDYRQIERQSLSVRAPPCPGFGGCCRAPLTLPNIGIRDHDFGGVLRLCQSIVRCFVSISLSHTRTHISTCIIVIAAVIIHTHTDLGGAYGTAKAGQGMMALGVRSPHLLIKNIIPVVMAGVLGIYGLIVSVILGGKFSAPEAGTGAATYSQFSAFSHLAAGLCCGACSLASGLAIGITADAGTRAVGAQSNMAASWKKMGFTGDTGGQTNSAGDALFVGTILIQVFAGNLGLYGLISALILSQTDYSCGMDG